MADRHKSHPQAPLYGPGGASSTGILTQLKQYEGALSIGWSQLTSVPTTISGYGITDAYTESEIDALLLGKADVGDSYTKAEDDALLAAKADSATSLAGYGIADAYTKTATDALFAALTAADIGAGAFSGAFTFDTKPISSAGFRLTLGGYELEDNTLGSSYAWSIFADAHRLQFFSVEAGATVFLMDQTGSFSLPLATTKFYINSTQILETRKTGWTAATGTATRTTFATSSVTTAQLAERVKALIDDLMTHGLIGA